MTTGRFVIYAMLHSQSRRGYVGQTSHLLARTNNHLHHTYIERWRELNVSKSQWLHWAAMQGDGVTLRVLKVCGTRGQASYWETHFIRQLRSEGWELMNQSDTNTEVSARGHVREKSPQ